MILKKQTDSYAARLYLAHFLHHTFGKIDTSDMKGYYKWAVLAMVMVSTFMAILDTTIVNVGFNSIMHHFNRGLGEAEWVTTAYLLSMTLMLPTAGWFAARFGFKKVYIIGMVIFTVGSLLSSLSPTLELLIASRVFEGFGSGIIQPLGMAIVMREFDNRERGLALGMWAVSVAASVSFGPFIGGELLTHYAWSSIFVVNVPIGIAVIIAMILIMHPDTEQTSDKFDLRGFLLIGLSLPLFVLSLAMGSSPSNIHGWSSPLIIIGLVTSVAMIVYYVWYAWHAEKPIMNVRIFRYRSFSIGILGLLFLGMGLFSGNYLLPLYLEHSLGYTVLAAGSVFLPVGLLQGSLAPLMGWVSKYTGNKILIISGLVIMTTYFMMSYYFDATTPHWYIMLTLYLRGVSIGLCFTPLNTIAVSEIPKEYLSDASGITNTVKQVSGSAGIALFTSLLLSRVATHSSLESAATAYIDGISDSFLIAALLAAVSIIPMFWLRGRAKEIREKGDR